MKELEEFERVSERSNLLETLESLERAIQESGVSSSTSSWSLVEVCER